MHTRAQRNPRMDRGADERLIVPPIAGSVGAV
jgi:hypothetical protein